MAIASPTILGLSEPALRLMAAWGSLALFVGLEALFPRRPRVLARTRRWPINVGVVVVATLLVRGLMAILPLLAATAGAAWAAERGVGLLHALDLAPALAGAIAFVLLDLAIWAQHFASHRVPLLWRLHRLHHADRDVDATTAVRFHPVEIALSAGYKLLVVVLLGPSVTAVVLFEVVLNAAAVFNHANLALPPALDRALRYGLVTPDMHRVHHSTVRVEQDRNYGFCLPWWDRLFAKYQAQPAQGHLGMELGLEDGGGPAD